MIIYVRRIMEGPSLNDISQTVSIRAHAPSGDKASFGNLGELYPSHMIGSR